MSMIDGLPELPPEGDPPDVVRHFEALTRGEQQMLVNLYNGPAPADLEELRSDPDMWAAMARIDVYPWLVSWFRPTRGWDVDPRRSGPIEGTAAIGVAWSYHGVHDEAGTFNGLPATGRTVMVQGFTVMGMGEGRDTYRFLFSRYIDWVELYGQLGLAINWRVPVPPGPEDVIARVIGPSPSDPDTAAEAARPDGADQPDEPERTGNT